MIMPEAHQHSRSSSASTTNMTSASASSKNSASNKKTEDSSYGQVLGEVTSALKDVFASEVNLFMTEMQHIQPKILKHIAQIVIFSAVLALSAFPLIAFLVIGLGELLDDRYWLSSLIVGLALILVGLPLVLQGVKKFKNEDFKFTQTKRSLHDILQASQKGFDKIKTGSKGSSYESESYN